MEIQTELIYRYPWLPSLNRVFSSIASEDPIEFIKETFDKYSSAEIEERILALFRAAFANLEEISNYKLDKLNVYCYLILKIFLYTLNNKTITNRIANLYSKITYNELINESDAYIYDICQDLNLKINYYQPPITYGMNINKDQYEILQTNFRIYFIDYLKLSANLRDDYRRLINKPLTEGFVFIQKKDLIRLMQEYVRQKLMIKLEENNKTLDNFKSKILKLREFKDLFEIILNEWTLKEEEFEYSFEIEFKSGEDLSKSYPPCINEILNKAQEGQNLVHTERLYILWFLNSFNYPEDLIISIFSTLPDFNREKTEYQVKYAKKKGYVPYSCQTLKSYNLCMAKKYKDELCLNGYYSKKDEKQKEIKHPLFYVRLKQFRFSNIQKNTRN
jgi:DNA primase large subunit